MHSAYFSVALARCPEAGRPALIELRVSPEALSPRMNLKSSTPQ